MREREEKREDADTQSIKCCIENVSTICVERNEIRIKCECFVSSIPLTLLKWIEMALIKIGIACIPSYKSDHFRNQQQNIMFFISFFICYFFLTFCHSVLFKCSWRCDHFPHNSSFKQQIYGLHCIAIAFISLLDLLNHRREIWQKKVYAWRSI